MENYIKSFVIGSSWPVFIFYFLPVSQLRDIYNLSYKKYSIYAPLFLGLLNVLGLYLQNIYDWTHDQRFLCTGLIGAILVSILATLWKAYNFKTKQRWLLHYLTLLIYYYFIYNVIVKNLERAI